MKAWGGAAVLLALVGAAGAAELRVPADHATIALAIAAATNGDTITVARGTYSEALRLKAGVTLQGEETAATIFTGGVAAGSSGTLQRVTVTGTGLAFALTAAGQALVIRNCVFRGLPGKALEVSGTLGSVELSRNTFYNNQTALDFARPTGTVEANLFVANDLAIAGGTLATVRGNRFYANGADGTRGTGALTGADPLLVAPDAGDLHLRAGSPAVGATAAESQGAYSGPDADPVPARVKGLAAVAGAAAGTASLTWTPNLAHDVAGYLVRFRPAAAAHWSDSLSTTGTAAALEIQGLGSAVAAPPAPPAPEAFPGDQGLLLRWAPVTGAAGYEVWWGTAADALVHHLDVGASTEARLGGLPNGTPHFAAVRGYGEAAYRFAVAARTAVGTVGADSDAVRLSLARAPGPLSPPGSATPEALGTYPDLPDRGGCFFRAAEGSGRALLLPLLGLGALGLLCALRSRGALVLLLLMPLGARGAGAQGLPWVASAQVGGLVPASGAWGERYDREVVPEYRLGVGVRPASPLEVGISTGYWEAEGHVEATRSGAPLGERLTQTLRVAPLGAYLALEGRFGPGQWVVPYLAAAVTRAYYRQRVEGGDSVRGHLSGVELRGGVKVLLDGIDPRATSRAREGFSLRHTYAVLEARWARLDDFGGETADLGGWSLGAGLALEF